MKKKLKELFSDEINIDFVDNIHIEEKKILNYIHTWPEKFYSAFIKIQKNNLKTYEIVLPSGEGTIIVQQNCKTKKIDVFFKKQTEKVVNLFRGVRRKQDPTVVSSLQTQQTQVQIPQYLLTCTDSDLI